MSAVIDTGYDHYLSLPFNVISSFGLPRVRLQTVRLGDGSSRRAAIYMIEVDWDGQFKRIEALCMPGDPVIGTALLKGYKLDADFISGGSVQVTRL